MASRAVRLVVLLCIVAGLAAGQYSLSSLGERILLEFPGHASSTCGLYGYPGSTVCAGAAVNFTVLQYSHLGILRENYYCTLAGSPYEYMRLAEDNVMLDRPDDSDYGPNVVPLRDVHCVLYTVGNLPVDIFDYRLTRLGSGLPPFKCIHLDADRRRSSREWRRIRLPGVLTNGPAPPGRNTFNFRFDVGDVPDLVCRFTSEGPYGAPPVRVKLFGFINSESSPLYCHYQLIDTEQEPANLVNRLTEELPENSVTWPPNSPATIVLPHYWCHDVMGVGQRPPPGREFAPPSSEGKHLAFTVTGPSGRWAFCWLTIS